MPQTFTCPQGHCWEDPFGDGPTVAPGQTVPCPVCGAPTAVASKGSAADRPSLLRNRTGEAPLSPTIVPSEPTQPPPEPGPPDVTVPGYEIFSELGRGGMGVVYKARQLGLKRIVALKMIIAGPHASTAAIGRFRAEAEAVARLQHPNIVQVYEIGEHEQRPYYSMEFIDGGNVFEQIRHHPFAARQAARLLATLARA